MCIGGRDAKPGITVYRFANRIPLLFEGGADVATQVSKKRINWGSYKIDKNKNKVGVFVSLVSTKVPLLESLPHPSPFRTLPRPLAPFRTLSHPPPHPSSSFRSLIVPALGSLHEQVPFKGTGKEYIGDDIPEVQAAVKRALEKCCLQLKNKIMKQKSLLVRALIRQLGGLASGLLAAAPALLPQLDAVSFLCSDRLPSPALRRTKRSAVRT